VATRAIALLTRAVQNQVYVLAYVDGFIVLGFTVIGALVLMLLATPAHLEQSGGAEVTTRPLGVATAVRPKFGVTGNR
jgi:hypothetical protein